MYETITLLSQRLGALAPGEPLVEAGRVSAVVKDFYETLAAHVAAALRALPTYDAASNTVAVHDVERAADRIYDDALKATLRGDAAPSGLLPRIVSMWEAIKPTPKTGRESAAEERT